MAGLTLLTAGDRSRLGDESLEDGLDDRECGDMGLANGEAPWWSAGIIRDSVVADADLMTLFKGLELAAEVCLSPSPDSRRWRARRAAKSLMALGVDGDSLSAFTTPFPRSETSPELPAVEMKNRMHRLFIRTKQETNKQMNRSGLGPIFLLLGN